MGVFRVKIQRRRVVWQTFVLMFSALSAGVLGFSTAQTAQAASSQAQESLSRSATLPRINLARATAISRNLANSACKHYDGFNQTGVPVRECHPDASCSYSAPVPRYNAYCSLDFLMLERMSGKTVLYCVANLRFVGSGNYMHYAPRRPAWSCTDHLPGS
jgi:hypothetical protein